ncbi:benzoate-CoA ligase family protein [Desulfosarcina ovata]|uniref:Acetyl-CoA synthetase n=1 Tax=Desulfosarcina ovata subsp. ovata TaxID=2752305 RepID=A0A5K8ACF2_9BACT|nr:benzoate-CoA ligase family protein [Desulfosarcina ovata]BBO90342.1 acetyl-CoA synthetase [Desulfosarcina ovata subsp. ovata]
MVANELALHPWETDFTLPETFNMVSLLLERHLTGSQADRTAIIYRDNEVTYRQLGRMTNQFGNVLANQGIKPGDRVVILLNDSPEYFAVYLGAMKMGAVPVPINMLATVKDLEFFIRDSEAAAVVMEPDIYAHLKDCLPEIPGIKTLLIKGEAATGTVELGQLINDASDQLDVYPTSKMDHSYWLYTSGTTGLPKGVIHLHKDLVYAVETWGRHVVDFTPDDRVFCSSKLYFSYGLNFAMYLPLYYGASVVINPDRPLPETILGMIEKYRPSGLFSVPTAYGQQLNYLEAAEKKPDLSSLRFCISAGEALPGSLLKRWRERFGIDILDGLGSSEVSLIFICNRPGKVRENASGLPLPGYAVEVRDELGKVLPANELGELWVKSNTLFDAYWKNPEKTAETLVDGWMKTGDMGHLDEDGYFFYSARANDTMKVSGIWVSPLEVEDALLSHPAVAECAVVGVEDDMGLIKPKAFINLKDGYQPGDEIAGELKVYVKQKLAPHKYPRIIEFVDELPKTATGKIQRYKLRQS